MLEGYHAVGRHLAGEPAREEHRERQPALLLYLQHSQGTGNKP